MTTIDSHEPALAIVQLQRPLIIGHRGYPQFAPENTLPSFRLALEAGADLVELDYGISQDGVPMVLHDDTLDRTSDAALRWGQAHCPLTSRTAAELRSLDAGSWFDPAYRGTHLPSLDEALDWIQGRGGMTLIERKDGPAPACVELLSQRRLINRVVVQSFDWSYLQAFTALEPRQVLGALGPPTHLANGHAPHGQSPAMSEAWLNELLKTGARVAVWNDDVSRESVALAHQRGLAVWIYTVNDPQVANMLLDIGVDGLITNQTSLMWRTLALRGTSPA
jgi:glycerophosphoryl diester phosphodiesterase